MKMKYYYIIIVLIVNTRVFAQLRTDTIIRISDIYALQVNIQELIATVKCPCDVVNYRHRGKCNIYRARVSKIYFQRDTTVYKDSNELKKIEYLVVQDTFLQAKDYSVVCTNSSSKSYLYITQLYNSEFSMNNFNSKSPFFTGLVKCKNIKKSNKIIRMIDIVTSKTRSH